MADVVSERTQGDPEAAVRDRYSRAAKAPEAELCCPTSYDPKLLEAIPKEVLERDYGCGNPAPYLKPGETVLDLGSGSGKICFIASQCVGSEGLVVGVDMNDEMLSLARGSVKEFVQRGGPPNVEFRKGRIQDLRLDLAAVDRYLEAHPVRSASDLAALEAEFDRQRGERPLVADGSVDVVISSCVLNLVRPGDKRALFGELYRVLRRGGRAIISDIVADEDIPEHLQRDATLWSGCLSGAFREDLFLEAFEVAGFHGIELLERQAEPWRTIEGIEFRSVTVAAYKGKEGPCLDQHHAVVYRGPFREVVDDDGHLFRRGARTAVCEKTFRIFSREPYRAHVELVPPRRLVPIEEAAPFLCTPGGRHRDPRETKGASYAATTEPTACCSTEGAKGGCG